MKSKGTGYVILVCVVIFSGNTRGEVALCSNLSLNEGAFLVKSAREAITEFLKTKRKIPVPKDTPESLKKKSGVFVTLNTIESGFPELRGCIGYPYPVLPLIDATIESAINSATNDPRFPPVTSKELANILIEVSVLTPPKLIKVDKPTDYPKHIKIGRDGLVIERGGNKGLLLPQVPIEWGWDEEEFLSQCCIKAGLPPDYWLLEGTKVYCFQAIVFEETSVGGEVKKKELESP